MVNPLCKTCGKSKTNSRAGSLTSFFFQHNYCQCSAVKPNTPPIKPSQPALSICSNCGKSRPESNKAGSFTSFLFKELRCTCVSARAASPEAKSVNANLTSTRTLTAIRVAQRKQFTESLRSGELPSENLEIFKPESIVGGAFKIVSMIGMGGMGVVYLAEHTALNRQFALKVLSPNLVNEQNWLRFQSEAKTIASLNHPIFVKVYDLGIHANKVPFYSMDYLEGSSLEEILAARGALQLEPALETFIEVLDGLAYAHRNNIVHRDLKPGNIMLCTTNGITAVKVLDFGISKFIGSDSGKMQQLTSAGEIFGSPFYMSPEQCAGGTVDARSDIYSIGCTLFETLTGYVPYEANTAIETVMMHQEQTPPLISDVLPDAQYPPSLDLVLGKCLAKLPQDRYQSAKELAIDLTRIKEGKDLTAYSNAFSQKKSARTRNEEQPESTRAADPSRDPSRDPSPNSSLPKQYAMRPRTAAIALVILMCLAASVLVISVQKRASVKVQQSQPAAPLDPPAKFPIESTLKNYKPEEEDEASSLLEAPGDSRNELTPYSTTKTVKGRLVRTFNFPTDVNIGKISIYGNSNKFPYGSTLNAAGRIESGDKDFRVFSPAKIVAKYPQYLKRFRDGDFKGLLLQSPDDSDALLQVCAAIPGVSEVTISGHSQITNKCIPSLNQVKILWLFAADHTALTGSALAQAPCWSQLRVFSFRAGKEPYAILPKLKKSCKYLKILNLADCDLTYQDFKVISSLASLRTLDVSNSNITKQKINQLAQLKGLEELYVTNCGIDESWIPVLQQIKGLKKLTFTTPTTRIELRDKLRAALPNVAVN